VQQKSKPLNALQEIFARVAPDAPGMLTKISISVLFFASMFLLVAAYASVPA
jgi:hypothetical protein